MNDEPAETRPLLDRLFQGEEAALAALFDFYRPRLRRMIELRLDQRVSARVDPSDVLQEAYLDVARQLDRYLQKPQAAFYVWLRGLTWERLLKLQRRHLGARCRASDLEVSLPAGSSDLLARQLVAGTPGPSERVLREELRQRVQRALELLGAEDREVILLRDFEGLSNGEAAQALGLSPSGATMRYGRALARLRDLLLSELSGEGGSNG
jgi:RNA polymerase sigma-70 factor (ECF subfamily)